MVPKNASKTLPSTWSDPSVNISLDNLVPGMQPSKPQQPSLNTMIQQQSKQAFSPICSCMFSKTGPSERVCVGSKLSSF